MFMSLCRLLLKHVTPHIAALKLTHQGAAPDWGVESDIWFVWCVLGVNMPDHAAMFTSLRRLLVKHVTPHVVSLHSSQCQTLKSAILNIAFQLVPSLSAQVGFCLFS